MELLSLIGDIDENFYQLGLKDKEQAKFVHNDVKLMLSTPWKAVNQGIEEVAKVILKNSLLKKTDYYNHLKSYSDGLGIKIEEAAYVMLVPEFVSCISKWAPSFMKGNLGCSSFFMRNENQEIIHGRILDFPLHGSYDLFERAILYDLNGMPKTLGFGSSGIPYPSITLMTEDGMTLALHQKFTNVFNKDGISIFELIFKLIKNASDKKSVIEFLKSHKSITTWCLYMSFKNGDILAADIMGDDLFFNEMQLPENGVLYFCNHLENKALNQHDYLPSGFHQYNLMREVIAQKKITQFLGKKDRSDIELMKLMATPYNQKLNTLDKIKHYNMDNITPSSLSVMTLNTTAAKSLYLTGEAPKLFRENVISIENCFSHPVAREVKLKKNQKSVSQDYFFGLSSIMKAQKGFDLHDPQLIYHHLQFAIDHLESQPEKEIAHFFFLVAQYIYENHEKVLSNLLSDFKRFQDALPQNLNDHCLLFIARLEKVLNRTSSTQQAMIVNNKLRDIYNFESKIPKTLLHLTTKNLIVPRMDIVDIIYAY